MSATEELGALEFLASQWELEMDSLYARAKVDPVTAKVIEDNAAQSRWLKLCEMRSDCLNVISRLRARKINGEGYRVWRA